MKFLRNICILIIVVSGCAFAQSASILTGQLPYNLPSGVPQLDGSAHLPAAQVNFHQNGTGAIDRTQQDKARDVVSVKDFGAVGDGSTDDTAAVQAAINSAAGTGKRVIFPGTSYKVTTLLLPSFVNLVGGGSPFNSGSASNGTTLVGTSGSDIIQPNDTLSQGFVDQWNIEKIQFSGGQNGINLGQIGLTNAVLRDVRFINQINAGFLAGMWIERSEFDHVEYSGGQYGFAITNNGNTSTNYIDKCVFIQNRFSGSVDGFFKDTARVSGGNTFISPIFNGVGQSPMVILGAATDWDILNPAFEANGTSSPATKAITTGSVTAASTALAVASATGLAVGQSLTIAHAGSHGADFYSTISAIAGTSITLSSAAISTVTSQEVTNCIYDEIAFGPPSQGTGSAVRINIIGGLLGVNGVSDKIRYSVNSATAFVNFSGVGSSNRPIYDPGMQDSLVSTSGNIRTETDFAGNPSIWQSVRDYDGNTVIPSIFPGNPGQGTLIGLVGMSGNGGTGPFGKFQVMSKAANKRAIFTVDADTDSVYLGPFPEGGLSLNFGIGTNTFNGGADTIAMLNGTAPTGNISGLYMYSLAGALQVRDSGGIVTNVTGGVFPHGVTVGASGTALAKLAKYTAALTPASVAANTCAEQTFTVTGVAAADIVYGNKPTAQAGLGVSGVRASAANTVGINYCNVTASPITPTAETYSFGVIQ